MCSKMLDLVGTIRESVVVPFVWQSSDKKQG
jgi:hypothetical protein